MTVSGKSIREEVQQLEGFQVFDSIGASVLDHFGFRPSCDYREAEVADPIIRAIALRRFANEVESGCLHQYLSCHTFDDAVYANESLGIIGEHRLAELLEYAIPLMSDDPVVFGDESSQKAAKLTRNPEYQDIEADFREAYELMDRSFYDNYAKFIKTHLDLFAEFDDPQKCQRCRERFPSEIDAESLEACRRMFRMQQRLVAWITTRRSLLFGAAIAGLVVSIIAFAVSFGVGCVTTLVSVLIILLLYFSWRPRY